ncbi:hypothetical protein MIR68_005974 [Amoeboaphelidium protococcarum]|nr:hypothetical protein MIR68_005974 [Amoeboaphelidium protococcarum]
MIQDLIKEKQIQQSQRERQLKEDEQKLLELADLCSDSLVNNLNEDIAKIFYNQMQIERLVKSLQKQHDKTASKVRQYAELANEMSASLKGLGDVQNWLAVLDYELQVIELTLRLVAQQDGSDP